MILCIVGSYDWLVTDIPKAKAVIRSVIARAVKCYGDELSIISGECPKGGVDIWAKEYAVSQGIPYKGYFPTANNKEAYMARNKQMAIDCDSLVRIVSPISATFGSGITAKWARELGKKVLEITMDMVKDTIVNSVSARRKAIMERNEAYLKSIKHTPLYEQVGDQMVYFKREVDDDMIHRNSFSLSINAAALEKCDVVIVNVVHRGVRLLATKAEIKLYKDVKQFHGECKYYYPLRRWEIIDGDVNWVRRIDMTKMKQSNPFMQK